MGQKISDKAFSREYKHTFPGRLTPQQKAALRGIASEQAWHLEQASVLLGHGTVDEILGRNAQEEPKPQNDNDQEKDGKDFCTECDVFVTPRSGKCPHCETEYLVKQTEKPKPMKGAPKAAYTGSLKPVTVPLFLAPDTIQIKLAYNRLYGSPASEDLSAFVAHKHPSWRLADGNDRGTGVVTLVLKKALEKEEVPAPVTDAADSPAGMRRRSPAPYEGTVYGETTEGTGKIGEMERQAYIKHVKGKGYCVYSHQTNKLFGCYPTMAEAKHRLMQMHQHSGEKHGQMEAPEVSGQPGPAVGDPMQEGAPPMEGAPGEPAEEEMSLEEAIELAPEVIETIVDKVQQGETLLHGQDLEPVEEPGELTPGEPGAGTPPLQEGAVPVTGARIVAAAAKLEGKTLRPIVARLLTDWLAVRPGVTGNAHQAQALEGGEMAIPSRVDMAFDIATRSVPMGRLLDSIMARYLVKHSDILRQISEEDQKKVLTYAIRENIRNLKRIEVACEKYGDSQAAPEQTPSTPPGKGQSLEQEEHMEPQGAKQAQIIEVDKMPSALGEDEYCILKGLEENPEGSYHLYHVSNGQLWHTVSDDPGSFNPNDAEPEDPETADQMAAFMQSKAVWTEDEGQINNPQGVKQAAGPMGPKVEKGLDDAVDLEHMKDEAGDKVTLTRGPHINYELDKAWQSGAYTFWQIKWDPDNEASQKQSPQGLLQDLKSYVQRVTSQRDVRDWGYPGRMQVQSVDPEAGIAEIFFRTQKPGDAPLAITQT